LYYIIVINTEETVEQNNDMGLGTVNFFANILLLIIICLAYKFTNC